MQAIYSKVFNFIDKHDMIQSGDIVYVATSGGADSMALLAFMNENKTKYDIDVRAVHVNHGIRDITAKRDENFVKNYCDENNIPVVIFSAVNDNIDVPENASEDWARELRYNYFAKLGNNVKIATAHTLSDQAETVLFRMTRGCGLNGLSGIPAVRDNFIRPVLCLTRAEIEQMVSHYGTGNITDETNLSDDYSRNKIRHHVIPVLKDINNDVENNIGKICQRAEKAYEYINKVACKELNRGCIKHAFWYDIGAFLDKDEVILDEEISVLLSYHNALNERYISIFKKYLDSYYHSDTEELLGAFYINNVKKVVITTSYVSVVEDIQEDKFLTIGDNDFGCLNNGIIIEKMPYDRFKELCTDKRCLAFFADAEKLDIDKLVMTHRTDGDRFKPACKKTNTVVNVLRNCNFWRRDVLPIVKDGDNIIYVWGVGFTDGYTPTEDTTTVYGVFSY